MIVEFKQAGYSLVHYFLSVIIASLVVDGDEKSVLNTEGPSNSSSV